MLAVDLDQAALATYRANHACATLLADVATLKQSQLPSHVDLVVASPPCQSFSQMGNGVSLPRPEDHLVRHVLRISSLVSADAVLIENVVGFLNKGDVHDKLLAGLERLGFTVITRTLNAADYGVPQRRKRVIIHAVKPPNGVPFPQASKRKHVPLTSLLSPRNAVASEYWLTQTKIEFFRSRIARGFARFWPHDSDKIAPTIMASYAAGKGESALIEYSPKEVRRLTEQECAKIQSFPKAYKWCGSKAAIYKQIGNAVPPTLAYHVGKWLMEECPKTRIR